MVDKVYTDKTDIPIFNMNGVRFVQLIEISDQATQTYNTNLNLFSEALESAILIQCRFSHWT